MNLALNLRDRGFRKVNASHVLPPVRPPGRHALRALAHGLSAYRGGADGALQLALRAGPWGTFLLRIEDTDRERSTPEATEAILKHRIGQGEANPTIVQGVATGQMETALSSAIKELYRQNYNQLSTRMPAGINLDDVFGESCRK